MITTRGLDCTPNDFLRRIPALLSGDGYFLKLDRESVTADYFESSLDPDGSMRSPLEERAFWCERNQGLIAAAREASRGLRAGSLVVDVGCGPGWLLAELDDKLEKIAVEPSIAAAEVASQWAQVLVTTANATLFEHESLDLVIANHVIEHLPDPVEVLEGIVSWLRPGGKVILGTPDFASAMAYRFGSKYRMLADPTHISLFTLTSLVNLVRDLGCRIDQVDFPFFDTPYFNEENLARILDGDRISPPFHGNFMQLVASKPALNG